MRLAFSLNCVLNADIILFKKLIKTSGYLLVTTGHSAPTIIKAKAAIKRAADAHGYQVGFPRTNPAKFFLSAL